MSSSTKLQFDATTQEPYLALSSPHDNIRITPPRLSDVPWLVVYHNDPRVYTHLSGPPFPHEAHHAEEFTRQIKEEAERIYADIRPRLEDPTSTLFAPGSPVRSIREVQPDGTQLFIGDIGIQRNSFIEIEDEEERAKLVEENNAKPVGDPTIQWCFGDFLAPSHHNKGIMSSAIRTIVDDWAVPYMNAHHIIATAFVDNIGSQRVFTKNGFKAKGTAETTKDLSYRGRTIKTIAVFEWKAEE